MKHALLAMQLAMAALVCAAYTSYRFLTLVLPWFGIPRVLLLFAACLATELALFGLRLASDDAGGEVVRRRACFVLYTFLFVIVDGWTTIAVLVYAAALRLVVRRDRIVHVHAFGVVALAWALLVRTDTLYYPEARLIAIDAVAIGVLALMIVSLMVWAIRRPAASPAVGSSQTSSMRP